MDVFGSTRSSVRSNHALITPDTHVRSPLVEWQGCDAIIHIAPPMGARFLQYTAIMNAGGRSGVVRGHTERFAYVIRGTVEILEGESVVRVIEQQGFVYIPPQSPYVIRASVDSELEIFEKVYRPLPGSPSPQLIVGDARTIASEAFMGDEDCQLKTLLPKDPAMDMAVNLFTFQPGATLPLVEVHVMEHGFRLLEGAGVYRLDDCYYPIKAGDVIWMGSFCPQWWVAMGKSQATYLYYKDVNRDCLEDAW